MTSLVRPSSATLAVHDGPPRRCARGVLVGIGVVHRRSIGSDDWTKAVGDWRLIAKHRRLVSERTRRTVAELGIGSVEYARRDVAVCGTRPVGVCARRHVAGSPVPVDARSRPRGAVAIDVCVVDPTALSSAAFPPAEPIRDPLETGDGGSGRFEIARCASQGSRLRASRHHCQCASARRGGHPTLPHDSSPVLQRRLEQALQGVPGWRVRAPLSART